MARRTLFLLVMLLVACSRSTPVAYYLLEGSVTPLKADSLPAKSLRVARVVVPEYLDRNGIVYRITGKARLVVAQFDVWAEPLGQGVRRVVREELAPRLFADGITVTAADDEGGDMILFLDVQRLDGTLAGKTHIETRWTLKNKHDEILGQGVYADEETARGNACGDFVQAQSALVCRMAEHLAGVVSSISVKEK